MNRIAFCLMAPMILSCVSYTGADNVHFESVEAEIAAARQAYLAAWMAQDVDGVMAYQAEDIVLLPHRGAPPVAGLDNVRDFWFPAESPPWTLYVFDQKPIRVVHEGSIAYDYGRYVLEYAFEGGDKVANKGNYLTVWRRQPDGRWLRAAQIWNHS